MRYVNYWMLSSLLLLGSSKTSLLCAQFVIPQIGGGQTGMLNAPMKHADITFDGSAIHVHVDTSIDTPELRALSEPAMFDPQQPWGGLDQKAYNFQYGWNPGGFISLPPTAWIWIERLQATPEIEVYQRPPAVPAYEQIWTAEGDRWKWPGAMSHNVYAVERPQQDTFEAIYRVYIGDEQTGDELLDEAGAPLYESDIVTFRFGFELLGDFDESGFLDPPDIDVLTSRILSGTYSIDHDLTNDEMLNNEDREFWINELVGTVPGDADLNRSVDFADVVNLAANYGLESGWASGDFDGDGNTSFGDFVLLSQHFGSSVETVSIPEPFCPVCLVATALVVGYLRRRTNRTQQT